MTCVFQLGRGFLGGGQRGGLSGRSGVLGPRGSSFGVSFHSGGGIELL